LSDPQKNERAEEYSGPVVFQLSDFEDEAQRKIAAARGEAERILREAREEGERIRRSAAEEGRAQGEREGREQGRAEGRDEGKKQAFDRERDRLESLRSALEEALSEITSAREELITGARSDLLSLSLLIARKVVAREVEADPTVTSENLGRALEVLADARDLKVRVAPEALETVREALPELERRIGGLDGVELKADENVSRGGCLVETGNGCLDATVATQLAEIERILFGDGDE